MKNYKKILFLASSILLLSSCSTYEYTTTVENEYKNLGMSLTKTTGSDAAPQFYNSHKMILEYQSVGMSKKDQKKMKEKMKKEGKLDQSYKRQIDNIVIKKKTPGICINDEKSGIMGVRFDPENSERILYFGASRGNDNLYLLMKNINSEIQNDYLLDYGGTTYKMIMKRGLFGIFTSSKNVKLLVEKNKKIKIKKNKNKAKGITIQDVNKGKVEF